jgi:hypothetical protein
MGMKHCSSRNKIESEFSSEKRDASAIVNEETKNKTVDQISRSYGYWASTPEHFSFGCDPGQ